MAQRQIGNRRVQADALGVLCSSGQQNGWVWTDQCVVWSEIPVMFADPIGWIFSAGICYFPPGCERQATLYAEILLIPEPEGLSATRTGQTNGRS